MRTLPTCSANSGAAPKPSGLPSRIRDMVQGLTSKRILVTGGAGFLGSHIVERLRQIGCSRIAAPRSKAFDRTREDDIETLFREFHPELVVHAAALVGGIGANRVNPGRFFYENALMGIQLIEGCRRH